MLRRILIAAPLFAIWVQAAALEQPPAAPLPSSQDFYPNPGIVAFRGGKWVGSDHLYNLTNRISVFAEILAPEKVALPVTEEMIRSRVLEIFRKGGIIPEASQESSKPPLPFFHMLLMIYPVESGFIAVCEGRLFEEVHLDRIILDKQTVMQGITWETESLVLAPRESFVENVDKTIDEIAGAFVSRFQFYEKIRSEIQK